MPVIEADFLSLLQFSEDLFWKADRAGQIQTVVNSEKFNPAIKAGEIITAFVSCRDESSRDWDRFLEAFENLEKADALRIYLTGTRGLIPVEATFAPVYDGKVCVGFQGCFRDIRELVRSEHRHQLAEDRFQTLFEASPSLISITNISDKIYEDVNPAFCDFHEKPKSQFIAQQSLGMSDRVKTNVYKDTSEALLHGKKIEPKRVEIIKGDGCLRQLLSIPTLIEFEEGPRLMVISTDITSELELQKSNGILRATLESMHHGVSLYDEDLVLILSNNRCLDLLDLPKDMGKAGTPFEDFMRYNAERGEYGPGDVEELVRERVELAKEFKSHRFDRVRPDGTVVEVEGHYVPGVGFISTYMDITERVQAEQEVRESERRLREIVDSLPFAFSLWDQEGRRVLGNSIWKDWYPEFYDLMPEIGGHFKDLVRNFVKYGLVDPMPTDIEGFVNERYESLWKEEQSDQQYQKYGDRWLHVINKVMPSGYVATIRIDVTDQRLQEEKLRQAQKMEAVGQLTGGVAHDFNNILSVIMGNIDIIEELNKEAAEQCRPRLNAINRAANRGAELTQQLLSFSRKLELRPVVTNLNAVIDNMSMLLRSTMGESVKLEFTQDPELWECLIDQGQLDNSLLNLCINARDAMSGAGRFCMWTKNIHLREKYFPHENEVVSGDYVKLTVADSGSGIQESHLKQVFEPFFTTKEVGKGSGLGLSMVFGFVRQSGGHIAVRSKVGAGTRFEIFLPRYVA
ncbi:PAS-domain containing protein [Sneathiella glossodoripedis]|uniref:PAS-domain containing protein n=1 Tax=Sneathiella glossodoripedis TaxID=418853 RepID=UPI00046EF18E|nr:PAS-domain containing protein [Sneathiella glossodoripedis]